MAPSSGSTQRFNIFEGSKKLGHLQFDFSFAGKDLVVVRHQTLSINKMLIKATFDEDSTERWSGNRLIHLESKGQLKSTIKDDSVSLLLSLGSDGLLAGANAKGPISLPSGASLFTLWRASSLRSGTYFNYSDGSIMQVAVTAESRWKSHRNTHLPTVKAAI